MRQISECVDEPHKLQFMVEQIEKDYPNVCTIRRTKKGFSLWRTDMKKDDGKARNAYYTDVYNV